jgi:hypothetical protein
MMSLLSLWSVGASAVGVLAAIRLVRYMMFELVSVRGQRMGARTTIRNSASALLSRSYYCGWVFVNQKDGKALRTQSESHRLQDQWPKPSSPSKIFLNAI